MKKCFIAIMAVVFAGLAVEHGSIKDEKEYVAGLDDGECKTFGIKMMKKASVLPPIAVRKSKSTPCSACVMPAGCWPITRMAGMYS